MLVDTQAHYMLYTRVEAPYSPRRRSGYQTVFASQAIAPPLVEEIERMVQCFQPDSERAVRRQFFVLSSGDACITHSRLIQQPSAEIIDRNQRPGAFIGNVFVIPKADFQRAQNDVFAILEAAYAHSLSSSQQEEIGALGQGGGSAANRHTLRLQVDIRPRVPGEDIFLDNWQKGEYLKLVQLAHNAADLMRRGQSLMFNGSAGRVNGEIEMLFALLDPRDRAACTFDTSTDGCNPAPGTFWAMGNTRRPTNRNFIRVDLETYTVDAPEVASGGGPKGIYSAEWLMPLLSSSEMTLAEMQQAAFVVQRALMVFEHQYPIHPDETANLPANALRGFRKRFVQRFDDGMRAALGAAIGKVNTHQILVVVDWLPNIGLPEYMLINMAGTRSVVMTGQMDYRLPLCSTLIAWINQYPQAMQKPGQWKDIRSFAQNAGHPGLELVAASQAGVRDDEVRGLLERLLSRADMMPFNQLLQLEGLVSGMNPAHLVHPRTMNEVIAWASQRRFQTEDQVFNLLRAILQNQGARGIGALTVHLRIVQKPKYLKELLTLAQSAPGVDPNFLQTLGQMQPQGRGGLFGG